ncbi:S24 family peptidase [Tannerella forsythia]
MAAVLIDGDATLKHFYRDGDSVTLVSSNPK